MDGGEDYDFLDFSRAREGVEVSLDVGEGARGDAAGDRFVSIEGVLGSNYADRITGDQADNRLLLGGGDDVGKGGEGDDQLEGQGGNDHVAGGDGEDTLSGGQGDDVLSGDGGADVLQGGRGSDRLLGGRGADIYFWGPGEGSDRIVEELSDGGSVDELRIFGWDASDLRVESFRGDVFLISPTGERLTIEAQARPGSASAIELVRFDDGTTWDAARIAGQAAERPNQGIAVLDEDVVIAEDAATVFLAATLLSNDLDLDRDRLSISAVADATGGSVELLASGDVRFTPDADYSGKAGFSYTVSDGFGANSTATVRVDVTPVNDAPTAPSLIGGSVGENAPVDAAVGQANALDVEGDALRYELIDDATGRFAIDRETGRITVRSGVVLDFETASSHGIVVEVDDGRGGKTSSDFRIGVLDANEAPSSLSLATGGSVAENAAAGTVVARFEAADPDAGDQVRYSLVDDAGGRFSMDARTGVVSVSTNATLDYESARQHALVVRATDSAGLKSDFEQTISVIDVAEESAVRTIKGTAGADLLIGSGGADQILGLGGRDTIMAGGGDDVLVGGGAADILLGGAGADVFRFMSTADAPRATVLLPQLHRETILDFSAAQGDRIDLSSIDANSGKAGDQEFRYIGEARFSGIAGELRYAGGLLTGDVNGDKIADFEIQVLQPSLAQPNPTLQASYFLL